MVQQAEKTAQERAEAVVIHPMDIRRKAQIGKGGATDHHGEVVLALVDMDIDKTIFVSLTSPLARSVVKSRIGVLPHWPDQVVHRYEEMYEKIPKPLQHDKAVIDFLINDADLSCEHADGSFMDHLQFCYEYQAAYFKELSPRILLLHSIMGVGTNYFPLKVEQIPKFKALLTEDEFKHCEAFPSFLRLLGAGPFLDELWAMDKARLDKIDGMTCYRVIDNLPLSFSKDEFWGQLNIHLIHTLDFLPCEDWDRETGDNFLYQIRKLYDVLKRADKLMAKVDLNLRPVCPNVCIQGRTGRSLGTMIRDCAPSYIQIKLARNQIINFSKAINHNLGYELRKSA